MAAAPESQTSGERLELVGVGGVPLVGEVHGPAHGRPVVLLHGGGQTRWAWGQTARALANAGMRAAAMDLRGHGESGWCPAGDYRLQTFAEDLARTSAALGGTPAVVGASLGGLVTLAASAAGVALRAVVLVDVTPHLQVEGVRRILGFMQAHPEGFASLAEAAAAVARYLPHRPPPKDLRGLEKNLRTGSDGRLRWHWDPRLLATPELDVRKPEDASVAAQRLTDAARTVRVPTLLVRGALSDLVTAEAAELFREAVPHARVVDLAAAGHMVAGDRNDAFTTEVLGFLRDL